MSHIATASPLAGDARPDELVDSRLVYAHGVAALATVLVAICFGFIISLQFIAPDLAGSWLSLQRHLREISPA